MSKERPLQTHLRNICDSAFHDCKVVRWDGDLWLLVPEKTYMFPIGHTRIGREVDDTLDIPFDELEDVDQLLRDLILQQLARIDPDE